MYLHIDNLLGFTSVDAFREETRLLSKHLNTSLNKLRKAVANRHGFKGVQKYEEQIHKLHEEKALECIPTYALGKGKVVYVHFFETMMLSSGGFDWYSSAADAKAGFLSLVSDAFEHPDLAQQSLLTRVEVSAGLSPDQITTLIDQHIDKIMMEHAGFRAPLSKDAFKMLANEQG